LPFPNSAEEEEVLDEKCSDDEEDQEN